MKEIKFMIIVIFYYFKYLDIDIEVKKHHIKQDGTWAYIVRKLDYNNYSGFCELERNF